MTTRQVELVDLRGRTLEDVLTEVAKQDEILTVQLPTGERITIQPTPALKPLPVLHGSVPENWKDGSYEHTD